jgi:hypothetical protein
MDKVIKIVSGLFIIIFVLFASIASYHVFVENAYLESLKSTYSYTCTISTDSVLTNVTLFIPVPADKTGNSPVVEQFSIRGIEGIPPDWKTALTGSNKGTYVEITTPVIALVLNGTNKNGYAVELSLHTTAPRLIDTRDPQGNDAVFHPMQAVRKVDCTTTASSTTSKGACYTYLGTVYADYSASPDAQVTIRSEMVGRNNWKIFEAEENEYRASISVLMFGDQHGWITAKGILETGIGSYNAPGTPS